MQLQQSVSQEDTLSQVNAEAGFSLSAITNAQGMRIASGADENQVSDKQSALVAKTMEGVS